MLVWIQPFGLCLVCGLFVMTEETSGTSNNRTALPSTCSPPIGTHSRVKHSIWLCLSRLAKCLCHGPRCKTLQPNVKAGKSSSKNGESREEWYWTPQQKNYSQRISGTAWATCEHQNTKWVRQWRSRCLQQTLMNRPPLPVRRSPWGGVTNERGR